jgi:general secretion pathway protein M
MNPAVALRRILTASPVTAAAAYAGLVVVLLFMVISSIADVLGQRAELASSATMLEQLEGRRPAAARGFASNATMPSGSAFLQRVAASVTKFRGNVLSSQLELQGTQLKSGFLSMIASCEIDQPELQPLLYELEAGMPFLFIDQLVVQTPNASSGSQSARLRILLAVSGQWRGAK